MDNPTGSSGDGGGGTGTETGTPDTEALLVLQLLVGHEYPSARVAAALTAHGGHVAAAAEALFATQRACAGLPPGLLPSQAETLTVSRFEATRRDLEARRSGERALARRLSDVVAQYLAHAAAGRAGDLTRLAAEAQRVAQALADCRYANAALAQYVARESRVSHQPDPLPLVRTRSPSRSTTTSSSSSSSLAQLQRHAQTPQGQPQQGPQPQQGTQGKQGEGRSQKSSSSTAGAVGEETEKEKEKEREEEEAGVVVSAEAEALVIYFKWRATGAGFRTNAKDWVGLFHYGDKRNMKVQKEFVYTGGAAGGSGCFLVPRRGIYELRYYRKGCSTPVYRTPQPITVGASVRLAAALSDDGRDVVVTCDPCAVEGKKDWVGLYHAGSWSKHYIAFAWVRASTRTVRRAPDPGAAPTAGAAAALADHAQSASAHASGGSRASLSTDEVLESSAAAAQSCTSAPAGDDNSDGSSNGDDRSDDISDDSDKTRDEKEEEETCGDARLVGAHARVLPDALLREGAAECAATVLRLVLPAPRTPGAYEVRYFCEKSKYQAKGCSPVFVVPNRDEMSVLATRPELVVQWRVLSQAPSSRDWIGVFDSAGARAARIACEYCAHHQVAADGTHDAGVVTFSAAAVDRAVAAQRGYDNGVYTWEIRFHSARAKTSPYLRIPLVFTLPASAPPQPPPPPQQSSPPPPPPPPESPAP